MRLSLALVLSCALLAAGALHPLHPAEGNADSVSKHTDKAEEEHPFTAAARAAMAHMRFRSMELPADDAAASMAGESPTEAPESQEEGDIFEPAKQQPSWILPLAPAGYGGPGVINPYSNVNPLNPMAANMEAKAEGRAAGTTPQTEMGGVSSQPVFLEMTESALNDAALHLDSVLQQGIPVAFPSAWGPAPQLAAWSPYTYAAAAVPAPYYSYAAAPYPMPYPAYAPMYEPAAFPAAPLSTGTADAELRFREMPTAAPLLSNANNVAAPRFAEVLVAAEQQQAHEADVHQMGLEAASELANERYAHYQQLLADEEERLQQGPDPMVHERQRMLDPSRAQAHRFREQMLAEPFPLLATPNHDFCPCAAPAAPALTVTPKEQQQQQKKQPCACHEHHEHIFRSHHPRTPPAVHPVTKHIRPGTSVNEGPTLTVSSPSSTSTSTPMACLNCDIAGARSSLDSDHIAPEVVDHLVNRSPMAAAALSAGAAHTPVILGQDTKRSCASNDGLLCH